MIDPAVSDPSHILVVDDDTRLRDLLQRYLSDQGFRVTTAVDAADARAKLTSLAFDLLVLDIMMPGESGLELTQTLRQESSVPILLLTAMNETEDRIAGFESGADDYLPKPFEPRELVLRINAVLRRVPSITATSSNCITFGDFSFDLEREELTRAGAFIPLTSAETSLLKSLALRAGEPIARQDLSEESQINGNTRTIDVQVTRLRRKIELDPKFPRYLQTVRGTGYVLMID
ncbi:response regulator [Pelagibius litoralis]|uniref:Response regulator n=1 Tax=Pelagibius litoralis TaxID=374515 RepID=A0A967F2G5_9PROT|nr:response regulator [Pelagibius litoralis]NIA71919.1 response regulator [Pelagibius litoralis]